MRTHKLVFGIILSILLLISSSVLATTYYVDPDGNDLNAGTSWATAFKTINKGIDTSANGDIVEVNEGTYYESVNFDGKAITLRSTDPNNWDIVATTIIDGSNGGFVVGYFLDEEGINAVLEGLTIRNGDMGVIIDEGVSPTVRKCIIENNVYAIACGYGPSVITNNIIKNNSATGIWIWSCSSWVGIKNNMIFNNGGWGINAGDAYGTQIINNTIVNNQSGGIYYNYEYDALIIKNCIIWGNGDDLSGCTATYSCVEDGDSGIGNISSYPYFKDYNNNDFHLTWNSPCINRGDPNFADNNETDIDGENRIADEEYVGCRVDIGADEFSLHINLIKNPGFEDGGGGWNRSGQINSSIPKYWQDEWSSTSKTIDSSQKHSGSFSWKFYNSGTSLWSGALADFVSKTNDFYKLSAWIKSANATEPVYFGLWEWNIVDYTSSGIAGKYFVNGAKVPTNWTKYTGILYPQSTSSSYFRATLLGPCLSPGTVWWDDFSLTELGPNFLYMFPYGVSDEPNISETINFGEDTNIGWAANYSSVMTSGTTDSGDSNIRYRSLVKSPNSWTPKQVIMKFPAFNMDTNGFPLTPMLLEIMYKDTTQSPSGGTVVTNYVPVYSVLRYVDLDPNYNIAEPNFNRELIRLGGSADGKWKYVQYAFQKSEYQLLRAINGYYTIKITSRNADIPIDYVSLRKITDEECLALTNRQRELRGFYEVQLPADTSASPPDYNNLTVYVRDIMKPVYRHTKPAESEIVSDINTTSAWGLVEPVSFAIYSQNGINDLTVEVNDLTSSIDVNSIISKEDILVSHVIYSETRLGYNTGETTKVGYALMPDYLSGFTTLSIEPNSSERIWISIKIPQASANLSGGLYEGSIAIKQDGNILATIPLYLNVLNITPDDPCHTNPIYWDPTSRVYGSAKLAEVLELYRDTGVEPFIGWGNANGRIVIAKDTNNVIIRDANGIADFNTAAFKKALDRMEAQGCLGDKMHIALSEDYELSDVYKAALNSYYSRTDINLYAHLSDANFVATLKKLLDTYTQIGNDPNYGTTFIFHVCDEPGVNPQRRILADRLYNIIHNSNCLSAVAYYSNCDLPLHISPTQYILPVELDHNLPVLTNLIDYKLWEPSDSDIGYSKHNDPNYYGQFGYYTTGQSHWRDPAYNRFLHGLFAFATDAKTVSAYAMGHYIGDPYNDFDAEASYLFPYTLPDFIYAYPTWNGKLYPTIGGIEGIREGIKDARYIATLKRLINEHPGADANSAQDYLDELKSSIDPNLCSGYYDKKTVLGYAGEIYKCVSDANDSNDFGAFTKARMTIINHIKKLDPNS